MSSTYRTESSAREAERYIDNVQGSGWIAFSACLLGLAGGWTMIEGFLAIGKSHVFVANTTFVFSDLKTWGWIMVIVGALTLIAAFAIPTGSEVARFFGIAVAGINAITQLGFVPSYPWWSIAMFAVDILVIYGLAAYGGSKLRDQM